MAFQSARCPSCGADIQVPGDREEAHCAYCGLKLKTKAAIAFLKVEHSGSVQMSGVATDDSLVKRGYMEIEMDNYTEKAYQYFDEALKINPENYRARKGIFDAYLHYHRRISANEKNYTDSVGRKYFSVGIFNFGVRDNAYEILGFYGEGVGDANRQAYVLKRAITALDQAIKFALSNEKASFYEVREKYVPKKVIEYIEKMYSETRCLFCGSKFSKRLLQPFTCTKCGVARDSCIIRCFEKELSKFAVT